MKNIVMIGTSIILVAVMLSAVFGAKDIFKDIKGKIVISTQNEIQISDLNISNKTPEWKTILESKDEYRYPAWSPDSKQVVIGYLSFEERKSGSKNYYLVSIDANGSDLKTLIKGSENYEYPAYSPDGKTIAFIAYPNWPKERIGQIHIFESSTKTMKKIEEVKAAVARPALSFDGQRLTFETYDMKIAIYDLKAGKLKVISEIGMSPIFHPDGKRIFYVQKGNNGLCSISIDGSNKKVVKKDFFDYLIKFSKDGRYLLYAGGGAILIPPGHEYSTLEMLNMEKMKSHRIFKGSVLYGASWIE